MNNVRAGLMAQLRTQMTECEECLAVLMAGGEVAELVPLPVAREKMPGKTQSREVAKPQRNGKPTGRPKGGKGVDPRMVPNLRMAAGFQREVDKCEAELDERP